MVIRTYIEKNNTIIKDTTTNTGRNPIAEIWYGGDASKSDLLDIYYILESQTYKKDMIMVNWVIFQM